MNGIANRLAISIRGQRHFAAKIRFVTITKKLKTILSSSQGKIDEANESLIAINSGIYTFSFNDGATVQVHLCLPMEWWMIIEHHSSQMPECND